MIEIIREREHIESTTYQLFFSTDGERAGSGYSFDCDANGVVAVAKLNAAAAANYIACLGKGMVGELQTIEHSYWQAAVGKCHCGTLVELDSSWANSCSHCGREYNSSGQLLAPRSQWGEETGERFDTPCWADGDY